MATSAETPKTGLGRVKELFDQTSNKMGDKIKELSRNNEITSYVLLLVGASAFFLALLAGNSVPAEPGTGIGGLHHFHSMISRLPTQFLTTYSLSIPLLLTVGVLAIYLLKGDKESTKYKLAAHFIRLCLVPIVFIGMYNFCSGIGDSIFRPMDGTTKMLGFIPPLPIPVDLGQGGMFLAAAISALAVSSKGLTEKALRNSSNGTRKWAVGLCVGISAAAAIGVIYCGLHMLSSAGSDGNSLALALTRPGAQMAIVAICFSSLYLFSLVYNNKYRSDKQLEAERAAKARKEATGEVP